MFLRERSYWATVALASYAGATASAAATAGERGVALAALGLAPAVIAVGWTATAPPAGATDRVEPGARAAARTALLGAVLIVTSETSRRGTTVFTHLGAALASVAGVVAIARASSLGGMLEPPGFARKLDAAAITAFAWTLAVVVAGADWVSKEPSSALALWSAYAGSAASIASLGILLASAARAARARRLELGVFERLDTALWLGGVTLSVGVAASALRLAQPEHVLPIAAGVTGLSASIAAATQRADRVRRATRHVLALVVLSTPPALAAAYFAKTSPDRAALAVVAACAACALVGMLAPAIARRATPTRHLWLDAIDAATRAAMSPDPAPALEEALLALRELSAGDALEKATGVRASTATLYTFSPPEAVTIDRAGFVHRARVETPASLVELAREEPDQVLRADVLDAVGVRRPEVRPVLAWMRDRGIDACALLTERDEPVGLLALPRGARTDALGLEEVVALRALGDRLAAVVAVAAKLGRSWERESAAREASEKDLERAAALERELALAAERIEDLLAVTARPARVANYSPAARTAIERVDSLAASGATATLLTAPGIDALAYAAHFHLAGPAPSGPFVMADGANAKLTDLMLWRSDASPIARARGGTLVLLHPELLPKLVQSYIGAAADERLRLCVVVAKTVDVLVARDLLDERFADRVGDGLVALPTLATRAEDLRALALACLGALGARFHGRPLGIEAAALGILGEHTWPGNDAELEGVLTRAAAVCDGHLVRRRDLALGPSPSQARSETTLR